MNSTHPYAILLNHFNKHQYKRGALLGSAPLDPSRRSNTRKRVLAPNATLNCIQVVCHHTSVLTAYPDGTIALNTNGWHTNITRDTLNEALYLLRLPSTPYVHSRRLFGLSQWCITTRTHTYNPLEPYTRTTYAFYDNMRLSPDTYHPADPRPFNARRIDTTQSRPLTRNLREFFRVLPLLHSAIPPGLRYAEGSQDYYTHKLHKPANLREALTSRPELWPAVVSHYTFGGHSLPTVRARILADAKRDLYNIIPATTTTV